MADAAESTTLYHPHIADLTRERSDPDEVKAHVEAGWLTEDPKATAAKEAEKATEAEKRSEAARKGAQTRKQKAVTETPDPQESDAPVVAIVEADNQ